jgi:4-alpha-glucanotransferase
VGRIYLPTSSYDEMGEWTLPPEAQGRFHEVHHAVAEQGHKEDWGPFVRGGIWQGFLAKYPESNFMHKRMCYVSSRIAQAEAHLGQSATPEQQKNLEQATRDLYRGQCNCAYWHGLFGGLYLAKLRSAVHSHMILAEVPATKLLGQSQMVTLERRDIDADLFDEVMLTERSIGVTVAPARGGAVLAIDDRKRGFCISDVLTRRPEAYHAKVRELTSQHRDQQQDAAPQSIHDISNLKDEGLAENLIYDPHQRLAFVDQFFAADEVLDNLWRCKAQERGDFKTAIYDLLQTSGGTGRLTLGRTGTVASHTGPVEVQLRKAFIVEENTLNVEYELIPTQPLQGLLFATEISLSLPSGPHPAGQYSFFSTGETCHQGVTSTGICQDVSRVELTDPTAAMTVAIQLSPQATIVRFPLETVSQSESGFERTYQGSVMVILWPCELQAGQCFKPALTLKIK